MRKAVAHIKGFPGASQALREDPADQPVDTGGFELSRALQLAPGMGRGLGCGCCSAPGPGLAPFPCPV